MAWSCESHSVCLGVVSQIKNFIKRSHVQLLYRRNKERDSMVAIFQCVLSPLKTNIIVYYFPSYKAFSFDRSVCMPFVT